MTSITSTAFSVATLNKQFALEVTAGVGAFAFRITGLTASGAVLTPNASWDNGTTWQNNAVYAQNSNTTQNTIAADGVYRMDMATATAVGFYVSTAGSGSITVWPSLSLQPLVIASSGTGASSTVTLAAGSANAGTFALATGGSVALAAGTASVGALGCTTTGGATTARAIGAATATLSGVVKASAGQVYGYTFSNSQTTTAYFRLYNSATVTVGTTAVAWGPVAVPAGSSVTTALDVGMVFGTGICCAATGSYLDNDTTTLTLAGTAYSVAYK